MKNNSSKYLLLLCYLICGSLKSQTTAGAEQPNIIFILTDDLGYGDIGVLYQNQRKAEGKPYHQTPHIDQFANEGIILTRHYAPAPVCAPSRASLMLGVHQGHADIRDNQFDKALPNNHNIASVLKQAGYQTGLIGKWGLQGREGNSPDAWEAYPTKRGFDYFFGYVRHGDGHNHYPAHESFKDKPVELYEGEEEISSKLRGSYSTDLFTAVAKEWIVTQREHNPNKPFFLKLSYDTPHAALQVAPSPYPEGGGLNGGLQTLRQTDKFINASEESIDDYIHPDYRNEKWPEEQRRFASMVRRIDDGIGDLMMLLKDLNIDDNTIIVFTSDNGPHQESYGFGPYKPTFFDSYGPLDGIKRDVWEGGIRVPTLVRWPNNIPAGKTDNTPSSFHDWMSTFADLSGVPAPAITDGHSLMPVLTGNGNVEPQVYVEYFHNSKTPNYPEFDKARKEQPRQQMQVVYLNGLKGIRNNIQSGEEDFLIYNTDTDPGETADLAFKSDPDKIAIYQSLQKEMKKHVLRIRRPNPTAPRPYDNIPVPALESETDLNPGIYYRVYDAQTPWVPATSSLDKNLIIEEGVCENFKLNFTQRDADVVVEFYGFLEIPETGAYNFKLQSDQKAIIRLHEAILIDGDKGKIINSSESESAILEQGIHPIRLTYAGTVGELQKLKLEWEGPAVNMGVITSKNLFHRNQ